MKNFIKKNPVTIIITMATVVLAGIAIFTAVRLYQLRDESVVPSAPESQPTAAGPEDTGECPLLTFNITTETSTPTATPTSPPTSTPTSSPTSTPTDSPTSSPTSTPTDEPTSSPTTSPTLIAQANTPTPTAAPTLPDAGVGTPVLIGGSAAVLLIFGAILMII